VSFSRLGDVALRLGQKKDALDFYRKSLPISQRVAEVNPKHAEIQRELSAIYNQVGHVSMLLGQTKDAADFSRKGLEIDERLAEDDPENSQAQLNISTAYERLGDVSMRQLNQTMDAQSFFRKSLQIRERLAAADPRNVEVQRGLAICYDRMGNVARRLGQNPEALDFYRKSLLVRQRRAEAEPKNAEAQMELFVSYYKMGDACQENLEFVTAAEWLQKAKSSLVDFRTRGWITGPRQLLGAYPVAQWQRDIDEKLAINSLFERAIADMEVVFTQKPEQIPVLLEIRLRALLQRKQLPEATVTAERWADWAEKQEAGRNKQRCNASCAFALCAAATDKPDPLVDRAVALLTKAKADGFFTPALIAAMKEDKDLDGIRHHPKFVQFMAELEAMK